MNKDMIDACEIALVATLELVLEPKDGTPEFRSWAVSQAISIARSFASIARKQNEAVK